MHIGQGSPEVYRVQPVNLGLWSVTQARRMASISACQVGSWLATTRFIPSETILPSRTMTAPKAPPVEYSRAARSDNSIVRRRNFMLGVRHRVSPSNQSFESP